MNRPRYKEPLCEDISDRQFLIKDQWDNVIINDEDVELVGAVLDNESIVKKNLGKVAYGAEIAAGIEQLLHPEIGAAVEFTGKFWRNPYKRVAVSMNPIMAVVYADDPYTAGNHVRNLHRGVNGTDTNGRKINALDEDAFYWAHETFRNGVQKTAEQYSRRSFTDEHREQLQLESNTWYSYYGMPMHMVPGDYAANLAYRSKMVDSVLEMNPSAERAINVALNRNPPRPENVPKSVWRLAKTAIAPVTEIVSLVAIGELDPQIRNRFGIPFSTDDQKHLNELHDIAKAFVDPLPDPIRYSPMAYGSLLRGRSGEHKNLSDNLIYKGLSLGSSAAKVTVVPLFKRAQPGQMKNAA